MKKDENEIIIYEADNGNANVEVNLSDETMWLTQKQISEVFAVDRTVIGRHIRNIYNSGELEKESTCAKNAHVGKAGDSAKREYETQSYNLDMILSIGYRVNSKKATAFRIWANRILKNYLVKGYAINERRFSEIQNIVQFITGKAKAKELTGHEKEILDVIERYAKTWKVLGEYDEGEIEIEKPTKTKFQLNFYKCSEIIDQLKEELVGKGLADEYFGVVEESSFEKTLENLYESYSTKKSGDTVEERAASLLYSAIKNRPFTDGNKRIGSLLFLYFLEKNNFLFKAGGEVRITDKTLVALALLVATSDPKEKETIIRLIVSLIQD